MGKFFFWMFLLAGLNSWSQKKKTTFFVPIEILVPAENSSIQGDQVVSFSMGFGLGLNLNSTIAKNFSILYGLEYASIRRNFILDGFGTYSSFSRFKLPVYFQYAFNLDRKERHKLHLMLGAQVFVQQNVRIGGSLKSSSDYSYSIENKGGVFPVLSFGFGYEIVFKNDYFMNIKSTYNMGFMNAEKLEYTSPDATLNYESKLSHYNIKLSFPLVKSQ